MNSPRGSKAKRKSTSPSTDAVAQFRRPLLSWWKSHARTFPWRHPRASKYHQVVSEALLQRTRAETVADFWPTFIARFPSWQSIAESPVREVERTLKPIGLSKQRAPRLKGLAAAIAEARGVFPTTRHDIEALPGVGQYIANAIELFASGKPKPLLDVNMARVLERFFGPRKLADIRYDPDLQALAAHLVACQRPHHVNWAVLDFAARVCTVQRPGCTTCTFLKECYYARKNKARNEIRIQAPQARGPKVQGVNHKTHAKK